MTLVVYPASTLAVSVPRTTSGNQAGSGARFAMRSSLPIARPVTQDNLRACYAQGHSAP